MARQPAFHKAPSSVGRFAAHFDPGGRVDAPDQHGLHGREHEHHGTKAEEDVGSFEHAQEQGREDAEADHLRGAADGVADRVGAGVIGAVDDGGEDGALRGGGELGEGGDGDGDDEVRLDAARAANEPNAMAARAMSPRKMTGRRGKVSATAPAAMPATVEGMTRASTEQARRGRRGPFRER